jgi:hypothetical protein
LPSRDESALTDPSSYGLSGIATFQNDGRVELTINPAFPTNDSDTAFSSWNLSSYPVSSATLTQNAISITTREGTTYVQNIENQQQEIFENLNRERATAKQTREDATRIGQQFNLSQMSISELMQYFQSRGAVVNNIGNGRLEVTKTISVWGRQIVTKSIFNTATSKMEQTEVLEGNTRKMAFVLDALGNQLNFDSRVYGKYPDSISKPTGAMDERNNTISISTSK